MKWLLLASVIVAQIVPPPANLRLMQQVPCDWSKPVLMQPVLGCYALQETSAYRRKGTDGTDPGVDVAFIRAVQECAVGGDLNMPACLIVKARLEAERGPNAKF